MLNMGGPDTPDKTEDFLSRLFTDREIIDLGGGLKQRLLGPFLAKQRTPKVQKQYEAIGGSPIYRWTKIQGEEMVRRLDALSPETAPHKAYIAFRYAEPLTEDTVAQMKADGVQRAVAFSQYPQYSCSTTGSSLNHLWRTIKAGGMEEEIKWSVIDRWFLHPTFINALVRRVELGLAQFPEADRRNVTILFSAHSLPQMVVARGDAYPTEIAATAHAVMQVINQQHQPQQHQQNQLQNQQQHQHQQQHQNQNQNHTTIRHTYPHILTWQSKVGYLKWLEPQTGQVLKSLGAQGLKNVLVVPIAFTSDHVETLYEIDVEYADIAKQAGIENFIRAPSLNDEPLFFDALATIVKEHLDSQRVCSPQYAMTCHQCVTPEWCRTIVNPAQPYQRMKDQQNTSNDQAKPSGEAEAKRQQQL